MVGIQHGDDAHVHRRTLLRLIGAGVGGVVELSGAESVRGAEGSYTSHSHGGLTYTKFVPDSVGDTESVPLMVMLHGCTQTADDFKNGTQMNEVAAEHEFIVIYPEQSTSRNYNRCWQWFNDANTLRGQGEVAIIAGMVDAVKSAHTIDESQIFVAGLSAGGAMAPNLAVEYGDVFSGVGIHSGLEYDVVENSTDGTIAMTQCNGKDPQQAGTEAYEHLEGIGSTEPLPTIVFHGTDDTTVYPCNGEQAVEQAIQTNDLLDNGSNDGSVDTTPENESTDCSNPHCADILSYGDGDGTTMVEHWIVSGMDHAWSGGDTSGSYTDPDGPDAARVMWEFLSNGSGNTPGNDAPTAVATADQTTVSPGTSVSFDASESADSDGTVDQFSWDFDDGETASGETVSHSFDTTGEKAVVLTVTDDAGATDTDTVTVTVSSNGYEGYCGVDSNYDHVQAGRAYSQQGYVYATGSDEYMGLNNTYETTRLKETSADYFEIVSSC